MAGAALPFAASPEDAESGAAASVAGGVGPVVAAPETGGEDFANADGSAPGADGSGGAEPAGAAPAASFAGGVFDGASGVAAGAA